MTFTWRQPEQTRGFTPVISGNNRKKNGGLMTRVEKGFSEMFMFIFSVVLHLSHSLDGEHGAKL